MPSYQNIREEELKIKIGNDYFSDFDNSRIIGNIDFCVTAKTDKNQDFLLPVRSFLWAEAKKGKSNIYTSFVQLILTIGKAKTYTKESAPSYLGAFDAYQMAFIPFYEFKDIFYQNDFNWNVTSSNYETKEFKQIYDKVEQILTSKTLIFSYEKDDLELRHFIKNNFTNASGQTSKIPIDRNNFNYDVYEKWRVSVKPSIIINWESAKKAGIIDGDFYLADLLSAENQTLKEKLYILLKGNYYQIDRKLDDMGIFSSKQAYFNDNQTAHNQFWNRYERPPREEYWDYIVERRDLLVPQDVRERKGSFFTPPQWVIKSQRYLADILGENWQDEYYIWDCAAGTGNLLAGLVDKYKIYASTLDKQDVDAMKDRIKNGANLLESHVFQFDFLNDSFDDPKVPESLRKILQDEEKRKKLVIYINPPYAEIAGNKTGVNLNKIHDKYNDQLAVANRELYAQFLIRIYNEIDGCVIGEFSKLKALSGSNFSIFRKNFLAKLEKSFIVPADTFDNVKGKFPIGFKVWNTSKKEKFEETKVDVFDKNGKELGNKGVYSYSNSIYFSKWITSFKHKEGFYIGWLEGITRNDFQSQNGIVLLNKKEQIVVPRGIALYDKNLIVSCISFAVRHCIKATWLNDRDQFLFPNDSWKTDTEFQNDCLAFTLFHGQNRVSSKIPLVKDTPNFLTKVDPLKGVLDTDLPPLPPSKGVPDKAGVFVNHWIPYTENEVNAPERFDSHFMTDFMQGKLGKEDNSHEIDLQDLENFVPNKPLQFSPEATAVFTAGRELWKYYFEKVGETPTFPSVAKNPSLYDIKSYFQGADDSGRMNNKSNDEKYNNLIANLRESLEVLATKIQPKVYEFGFLK